MFMAIVVTPAALPLGFSISWAKCSAAGAIAGTLGGLAGGLATWLAVAASESGSLTVASTVRAVGSIWGLQGWGGGGVGLRACVATCGPRLLHGPPGVLGTGQWHGEGGSGMEREAGLIRGCVV